MKKHLLFLVFCCWVLSGCIVGSIDPFYKPELVVEKPDLYGRWDFEDSTKPENNSQLVLSPGKVTVFDDDGKPLDAKITFFMVEDSLFADIYPHEGPLKAELVGELPAVHLVVLLKAEGDKVKFYEMDYQWLSQEVVAKRIKLRYTRVSEYTDVLFTPSSQEWVEFLKTYRNNPKVFPAELEGVLIRKPEFLQSKPE